MIPVPSTSMVGGLFSGFTRLSKAISVVLAVGFLIVLAYAPALDYLALVPGKTIPFAWNLVTAGYIENSPISLAVNILALLVLGKSLEPIWGSKEFFWFILVVNTWTAISTFVLMIVLFYISPGNGAVLYAPICGFHGVVAGLLVGIKQLMPEQEIGFGILKLRAKWIPSLAVVISTGICAALGGTLRYLPFIVFGTFISWIYLRFFQVKADSSNLKGDPSNEEFAFATFFPDFMRPVVNSIATVVGRIFCGKRGTQDAGDAEFPTGPMPLPGSDPAEASRRRERGARALEERLAKAAAGETIPPGGGGVSALSRVTGEGEDLGAGSVDKV
eukprot:TRINITY_DN4917_c0_g1_i1.p1 TRINITY_DN4917_c0_g1~~TRINITY_DN4917_c0_g1_i1.p1  ORF type:complete len:331 (-),score=45.19 TRINITY_DN4917_c0_g1_i1:415-1407(-)